MRQDGRKSWMQIGLAVVVGVAACGDAGRESAEGAASAGEAADSVRAVAMEGAESISESKPYERIPVIDAYYEGEKAWFIHTDVSDSAMANRLSQMVGYRTMHVPELNAVPENVTGDIYVFRNGVDRKDMAPWGGGPFHFQIDVLSSVPGDEGYSPLRSPHMVTWKESATPRILRSVREIRQAEAAGELAVEPTGVVVNAPVVKWPTGQLGGEARMPGAGTGPAGS